MRVGRAVFWLLVAIVLSVITHFAYALFVPSRQFDAALSAALKDARANSFVILDPAQQTSLLSYATRDDVVGLCKYDVRQGPVVVSANVPEAFWTFAVYTNHGRQVYALNDTQADSNAFTVELSAAKSVLAQITSPGDDAETGIGADAGWRVAVTEPLGIAVLWIPLADGVFRADAEAAIRDSRCGRKD